MAAAVLLGHLSPFTESSFPRTISFYPVDHLRCTSSIAGGRKTRLYPVPHQYAAASVWPRRGPCTSTTATPSSSPYPDAPSSRSRPVAANFASGGFGGGSESDDEEEEEEEEGNKDREERLRSRLKELEDMKELELRAEELSSRMMAEGGGDDGETEEEKRERVRKELEMLAKEQAERRETAKLMFDLGQKAYGKGMYARAVEFLEGALTVIPGQTLLGGEIQMWLALAYEANNRRKDCIELYQQLEKKHPSVSIRRQAAELRYILQAPKLKISEEEMVTMPLIGSSYDSYEADVPSAVAIARYATTWSDKYKDRNQKGRVTSTSQTSSSKDLWGGFIVWPADWEKSRAFWFAVTLWLALVGVALLQN